MKSQVIVQKKVYEKFYELLSDKFFQKYFPNWKKAFPKKGSREMWGSIAEPGTRILISAKLFETRSHEYFYRRYLEVRKDGQVGLNIISFAKALEFIGITLSGDTDDIRKVYDHERANLLYDKFLKIYFSTDASSINDNVYLNSNFDQYILCVPKGSHLILVF
jgi:hypothetical protein